MGKFFNILEIEISSFEEYVSKLYETENLIKQNILNSELPENSKNILVNSKYDTILFRGQENENYDLIPKIGRKGFHCKHKTEEVEFELFEEFKRRDFLTGDNFRNFNDWDFIALSQHHGLPTRLLDWSENPLVALWFCFMSNFETDNIINRSVWGFMPLSNEIVTEKTNGGPYQQDRTMVFKPRNSNNRIISQQGWFTVHKFTRNNCFVPFNKNNQYNKRIIKFIFSNHLRDNILKKLDRMNINHYSIFPDREGLCRYLQWKTFNI